jgi:hypothetical protein
MIASANPLKDLAFWDQVRRLQQKDAQATQQVLLVLKPDSM